MEAHLADWEQALVQWIYSDHIVQVASNRSAAADTSGTYPIISTTMVLLGPEGALSFQGLVLDMVVTFAEDDGCGRRMAVPVPAFAATDVFVDISAPGIASMLPSVKRSKGGPRNIQTDHRSQCDYVASGAQLQLTVLQQAVKCSCPLHGHPVASEVDSARRVTVLQ